MIPIHSVTDQISYFNVPYKDIFVGIYVIRTEAGTVLFDTAGCDTDIDAYILPALEQLKTTPSCIFISHNHLDHAGGLARAMECFPNAVLFSRSSSLKETYPMLCYPSDGDLICDVLQVVTIPGHTADAMALLDRRTNTLISGDCLQAYGIFGSGYWYSNITLPVEHLEAIRKLRSFPLEILATAHDYHPHGMVIYGQKACTQYLDSCTCALTRLHEQLCAQPLLTDEQIADLCNDGSLPKVSPRVINALRNLSIHQFE
ncbi:MAG: MBL fold metallo-hydrolase [Firmicutes bacterium]|nr:MBL fold metallo-hydrolase [Bacillota bacterium]